PDWRSSKPWSSVKFTVATRTVTGIGGKSPTMHAVGAGGTLNSRDFDILIVDDFEDLKGNYSPDQQEKNRIWFGQTLTARKMSRTAIFSIGSRQAEDDMGERLLENPEWNSIVDYAHSPTCELDPYDEDAHVSCMLFPELFPYSLFMSRRRELETLGLLTRFHLIYQNTSSKKGGLPYSESEMRRCLNYGRRIGEYPPNLMLIAGLDPAPTNTQAAFLWGYDPDTTRLYVIDIATLEEAGIQGARAQVREWFERYQLRRWVIEEVGWQKAIIRDEMLRAYCATNGIIIEPHETQGYNKWDPRYGVAARGELYETVLTVEDPNTGGTNSIRKVDMPYGDIETQVIIDGFINQAKRWSPASVRAGRGGKSDMLMAAWFPFKVLDQWARELEADEVELDYEPFFSGYTISEITEVPW
ncbi:MAG: hypothetical protein NUV49_00295, partial [Patescibacteria group bacterium]|nr:hypothetical protein [Patescibacteria group bacterium]